MIKKSVEKLSHIHDDHAPYMMSCGRTIMIRMGVLVDDNDNKICL